MTWNCKPLHLILLCSPHFKLLFCLYSTEVSGKLKLCWMEVIFKSIFFILKTNSPNISRYCLLPPLRVPFFNTQFLQMKLISPDWCSSVGWAWPHKPKGPQFDSQFDILGLQARFPGRGVFKRQLINFSLPLFLLPFPSL